MAVLLRCRLAKDVCCQIEDRLCKAHASFENSMRRLENCYSGRLRKTESHSLSLRKKLAPRIARLALESRSLRDFVMHGQPRQLLFCILAIQTFFALFLFFRCLHFVKLRRFAICLEILLTGAYQLCGSWSAVSTFADS